MTDAQTPPADPVRAPAAGLRARLETPVLLVVAAVLAVLLTRQFGTLSVSLMRHRPLWETALTVLKIGVLYFVVRALVFSARRRGADARAFAVSGAVACAGLGVVYAATLDEVYAHNFHGELTCPSNADWVDDDVNRPRVEYRLNEFGLRRPSFTERKAPGVYRIALVGDSFVFGLGVTEEQTLKANLERLLAREGPGAPTEVLNLGVPGNNVGSHAGLVNVAAQHLGADAVVLGLTLDNDLNPTDQQTDLHAKSTISAKSLAGFLFTGYGVHVLEQVFYEVIHGREDIGAVEQAVARMEPVLSRPGAPEVVVLPYRDNPRVRAFLERHPRFRLLPPVPQDDENFLPHDGHPTPRGNEVFARHVLDGLRALPSFAALRPRAGEP